MKLFILNKDHFEDVFGKDLSRIVHQRAYRELYNSLAEYNIPLVLTPNYKEEGVAIFDFKSKKGDIYFYEFATTAS